MCVDVYRSCYASTGFHLSRIHATHALCLLYTSFQVSKIGHKLKQVHLLLSVWIVHHLPSGFFWGVDITCFLRKNSSWYSQKSIFKKLRRDLISVVNKVYIIDVVYDYKYQIYRFLDASCQQLNWDVNLPKCALFEFLCKCQEVSNFYWQILNKHKSMMLMWWIFSDLRCIQ